MRLSTERTKDREVHAVRRHQVRVYPEKQSRIFMHPLHTFIPSWVLLLRNGQLPVRSLNYATGFISAAPVPECEPDERSHSMCMQHF